MSIQAIQTRYKGYHFRSRLEARWAVFFDALGYKWEYEPEGFVLPSGHQYLPDFKTTSPTGIVQWYEVKPYGVKTSIRVQECCDNGMPVSLLSGDPLEFAYSDDLTAKSARVCPRCGFIGNVEAHNPNYGHGEAQWHFICHPCDRDTPSGGGHPKEQGLLALVQPHKGSIIIEQPHLGAYLRKVYQAAVDARSARFEHGQSGASL